MIRPRRLCMMGCGRPAELPDRNRIPGRRPIKRICRDCYEDRVQASVAEALRRLRLRGEL
jgi:hypothetical protein